MVILRQQMRAKPGRTDDVLAALAAIVPGARATQGVISLDIARDLLDPDSFVATGVYEDGAALERQESTPEVHNAMAMFSEALAAPPDRKIYDASRDPRSSEFSTAKRDPSGVTPPRRRLHRRDELEQSAVHSVGVRPADVVRAVPSTGTSMQSADQRRQPRPTSPRMGGASVLGAMQNEHGDVDFGRSPRKSVSQVSMHA
jgi:quinol monooxygenase YgiN